MKYKLTDETITIEYGIVLHRIEYLKTFADIKAGEKGGWIEKEDNLSHNGHARVYGNAWVYDEARVYGADQIYGDAHICGHAEVYGEAEVYDRAHIRDWAEVYSGAQVYGKALVCGTSRVYGMAQIGGDAKILYDSDYIVFKNNWSSGRYFTWTHSNDMWRVGCFYGTGQELIEKAYKDSKLSGDCYKSYVELVEKLKEIQK